MDSDAIVAAMRSPGGASAAILRTARAEHVTLLASASLCLEYESVLNGQADAIVTFNRRDFMLGSARFELDVLLPSEALWRIKP